MGAAKLDHGGSYVRQGVWELNIGVLEGGGVLLLCIYHDNNDGTMTQLSRSRSLRGARGLKNGRRVDHFGVVLDMNTRVHLLVELQQHGGVIVLLGVVMETDHPVLLVDGREDLPVLDLRAQRSREK